MLSSPDRRPPRDISMHFLRALPAGAEEVEEGQFEGLAGGQGVVAHAHAFARLPRGSSVGAEFVEVILSRRGGIDVEVALGFHVEEQRSLVEVKLLFGGIEQMKEEDFMSASDEAADVLLQRVDGRQQVGDENH